MDDFPPLEPTLQNILDAKSLRWIFCGGKGGVGKTTTSCSLSVAIANEDPSRSILLVSTDPAHNLSDAFGQKFTGEPTPVNGVPNLHAMEVDSQKALSGKAAETTQDPDMPQQMNKLFEAASSFFTEGGSIPGMDE
ncbi:arsenical pump ATPase, ArsA/GET3, partial [Kipferlia bialata]|eukprot:g14308.t1